MSAEGFGGRRLGALLGLVLWLGSCSWGQDPREVAEGYLGALAKVDFPAAAQFVTDDGQADFDALRRLYGGLDPVEQKKFRMNGWKVTLVTVTGDTATVDFVFDGDEHGQLSLRRVGGWKVDHRRTF